MDEQRIILGVAFAWNVEKARRNLQKHGVDFASAAPVVLHQASLSRYDEYHSVQEDRFVTIGWLRPNQMWTVVHTDVAEEPIRIITARLATPKEPRLYEQEIR